MIFPQLGPEYLQQNSDDKSILARIQTFYAESVTINQAFWQEADTDTRYEAGDQSFFNDLYGNLPANRRRQFNFNRIKPVINMISGYQRRNRKSTIATPIENGDAETADQFTKIFMHIDRNEGLGETISKSFHGSLVTGMNLLYVWNDLRSDPVSGNIKVDNCDYNSFLIDPYFRKMDLSDCRGVLRRQFMNKRQIISILPQYEDEILGLMTHDSGSGRDGKFQFMPESYSWSVNNLLTYDEFWYQDFREQRMLIDSETGESMEWTGKDEEALKLYLQMYPTVSVIKQSIPTVRLAIVIENKVFYHGPNPLGIDKYPFVPVFSYYNPQMPYMPYRVCGVVRGLRDAQYLYNRRKAIELDILESQINSGFKYKENALVNPKDIFLTGQGRGLALKDDALMTDVERIDPAQVPPSMIELSKILADEIMKISGVNEELLGAAIDDKAGILSMLRQGAGLTTLQVLFDNLDFAQKLLGNVILDIIQANYMPGKVKKILEGAEPTAQFYQKAFGKYGAAVEEGLNTTTQKQMQFAQLVQLRELNVPVPNSVLLDACTITNKKELIDAIKQDEQKQAQMQQIQMQVQMEKIQADTQLAKARSIADEGLGVERMSRVQENQALAEERRAQAVKDEDIGFLNLVKALKELDSLDIANIEKLLTLSNAMKANSVAEEKENITTPAAQPMQPTAAAI
jgi:hypothetical protein